MILFFSIFKITHPKAIVNTVEYILQDLVDKERAELLGNLAAGLYPVYREVPVEEKEFDLQLINVLDQIIRP